MSVSISHEHVRLALMAKVTKSSDLRSYFDIIKKLRTSTDATEVRQLFLALAENAAILSKYHNELDALISLLLLYDWTNGELVSEAFEKLILGLVSSHAGFLEPVFQHLVSNFLPTEQATEDSEDDEDEDTAMNDGPLYSDEILQARSMQVHHALKSILQLIPLGCSTLLPVIFNNFPKTNATVEKQTSFLKECLKVCDYVPIIRDRILALAVERVLLMDTEIHVEDIEKDTESKTEEVNGQLDIFSMEEEGQAVTKMDAKQSAKNRLLAEKVDLSLQILFDYIDKQLEYGYRASKVLFELLLNIFDRIILRTKNSKFTQYLLFYMCRKRPEFVESFVERLLQRALGDSEPSSVRFAASSYVASFLSRALYVNVDAAMLALKHLMEWIHHYSTIFEQQYMKEINAGTCSIYPQDHMPFFAICQASVYILMFKGDMIDNQELQSLQWDVIVTSVLKPASYFSDDILEEFIRYTERMGLLSNRLVAELKSYDKVMSLYGQNAQLQSTKLSSAKTHFQASRAYVVQVLRMEYPFDPCLLQRTSNKLQPFYQQWLSQDREEHMAEYAFCESSIDRSGGGSDDNDRAETYMNNNDLMDAQSRLPPPIQLQGLSSRAAMMLTQLGAHFHCAVPHTQTPPNFWAFAFDPHVDSPSQSYSSSVILDDMERDRRGSVDIMSQGSSMAHTPVISRILESTFASRSMEDDNLSGSW